VHHTIAIPVLYEAGSGPYRSTLRRHIRLGETAVHCSQQQIG